MFDLWKIDACALWLKQLVSRVENHPRVDPVEEELAEPPDLAEPFHGPLEEIPHTRTGVYKVYGNPPKSPKSSKFPTAKLVVERDLPGTWNNGKNRLYVHEFMGPYLREALRRCDDLGVLGYIERMGSFNHRHIRHNPKNPLSYHSWAIALDINSKDNKAKYQTAKQPIPPPFSAGWQKLWPKGVPYELVNAFHSVGFSWGGDWGHRSWTHAVEKHGVGYEVTDERILVDWKKVSYTDPMHFELIARDPNIVWSYVSDERR